MHHGRALVLERRARCQVLAVGAITVTRRFAVDGAERLGFELGSWGSCHWGGPSVYPVQAEAR